MRLREAPEVRFFNSPAGIAAAGAASVALMAGLAVWARRGDRRERRKRAAMLASATAVTALSAGLAVVGERRGWYQGAYFDLPGVVRFAFDWPLSVGVITLWLAGYRALTADARHPYWIAGTVSAALAPLAITAGQWEQARGYFRLGHGWRHGHNALLTPPIMLAPVLLYEGLRPQDETPVTRASSIFRQTPPAAVSR